MCIDYFDQQMYCPLFTIKLAYRYHLISLICHFVLSLLKAISLFLYLFLSLSISLPMYICVSLVLFYLQLFYSLSLSPAISLPNTLLFLFLSLYTYFTLISLTMKIMCINRSFFCNYFTLSFFLSLFLYL